MKECRSGKGKNTGGKGKGKKGKGTDNGNKGKGSGGTKDSIWTRNTFNCWKCGRPGYHARDCRSIATVGEGETSEDDWTWNAQQWNEQQPEPETASVIGDLRLCSLGGQANASNPHFSTVTSGVDSEAEVTVTSPDTASDCPRERGPKKAMCDCTGKPVEDMGDKY